MIVAVGPSTDQRPQSRRPLDDDRVALLDFDFLGESRAAHQAGHQEHKRQCDNVRGSETHLYLSDGGRAECTAGANAPRMGRGTSSAASIVYQPSAARDAASAKKRRISDGGHVESAMAAARKCKPRPKLCIFSTAERVKARTNRRWGRSLRAGQPAVRAGVAAVSLASHLVCGTGNSQR